MCCRWTRRRPVDPSALLQATAASSLGSFVLNCGGVLLDSGWLRIYGSPNDHAPAGTPSFAEINDLPERFDPAWRPEGGLVIAHDVLGGVFVVNGPDPAQINRPGGPGEVLDFAPDSLRWTRSAWATRTGSTGSWTKGTAVLRHPALAGWRAETGPMPGSHGITFDPVRGRPPTAATFPRPAAVPSTCRIMDLHRGTGLELDKIDLASWATSTTKSRAPGRRARGRLPGARGTGRGEPRDAASTGPRTQTNRATPRDARRRPARHAPYAAAAEHAHDHRSDPRPRYRHPYRHRPYRRAGTPRLTALRLRTRARSGRTPRAASDPRP